MFNKSLKFAFVLLLLFTVSTAAFTPQFADENKTMRLRWRNPEIRIALSTSLLNRTYNFKTDTDVQGSIERSLKTWENVANIKFQTIWTEKQSVSPSGNAGDGVSLITIGQTAENYTLFQEDLNGLSAQTRTFFNRRGQITEADIVLNPYQSFSSDGSGGSFDLEATLTHEIGHLLGLEHSFVMGATMYLHQGKNGVYDLPSFSPRTLAEDDITGVRAIYGAKDESQECCGAISGKLLLPNGKPVKDSQVWAEEAESGRVISGVSTNSAGDYFFDGLMTGEYKIYAKRYSEESSFTAENIGTIAVEKGKTIVNNKKLQSQKTPFKLQFAGFNNQISELAVPVNGGKSYIIYIGGKNLDTNEIEMSFNSPNISISPNNIGKYDYGNGISVVSFEVRIAKNTPLGEYGIFVGTRADRTTCLAGSLTVEEFENNLNIRTFDK